MLSNYFTIAFRNLWRNRVFVFTNALALGISIAAFIAAYLWVAYDQEFDNFHKDEKVANVYKLHALWDTGQNILSPFPLGPTAASDITSVRRFTRYSFEKGFVSNEERGFLEGVGIGDSSFFSMFDFPVFSGNIGSFESEHNVVISRKLAEKIFGEEDPIQKPISVKFGNHEPVRFYVGAVIQDIPHNTSFTFDLMIRIEQYQKIKGIKENEWSPWPAFSTFFEISEFADVASVNLLFQKYTDFTNGGVDRYKLEHFKADFTMSEILGAMVNLRMWQTPLRVLVIMAIGLFMIACFNLSNTSFSIMSRRMKEIGVRRSLGASRNQIITQFLAETGITIIISLVVGLFVSDFIVPKFADIWAQGIGNRWDTLVFRVENINQVKYLVTLVILGILGISLAGLYPAISFSKMKPTALFKGNFKIGGTNLFNRFLLAFQFSISLIMLIAGLVFTKNSNFMLSKDVGFDKDQIIYLKIMQDVEFEHLQRKVDQIPGVEQTTWSKDHLGSAYSSKAKIDEQELLVRPYFVSEDYLQLMGIQLMQGRGLSKTEYRESVLVTEKFTETSNTGSPIGKILRFRDQSYLIVGVVNDVVDQWHMSKNQSQIPQIFMLAPPDVKPNHLVVRSTPDQAAKVQDQLRNTWNKEYPLLPFYGGIMLVEGPVKTSRDIRSIFLFLTAMTVFLSCLGIYTLAALNVRRRINEIGIRKVLGSSIMGIVKILNREFLIILIVSALIGSFLSHWLLKQVAQSNLRILFIEVGWELLAYSAVLLIVVGLVTSGVIIAKGASRNPASALRDS